MNIQQYTQSGVTPASYQSDVTGKTRRFDRHNIKRRVLIKDPSGNIQTAHAFDISHQGIQVRCSPKIAYQLKSLVADLEHPSNKSYELKIALPYMNQLVSCGIKCKLSSFERFDSQTVRLGFEFVDFETGAYSRLNHFIENLSV